MKLTSSLIKSVIQPLWTKHKGITKHDISNLHVKILRLMPTYSKTNGDYDDMLDGTENDVTLDDDAEYELT